MWARTGNTSLVLNCILYSVYLWRGVFCAQRWVMHENCGREFVGYGGDIVFDSLLLPPSSEASCHMTIIGNGSEDSMLSLFFTTFNITVGCGANLTIQEIPRGLEPRNRSYSLGLKESFCVENPYLNENLMYTTNRRYLKFTYTKNHYQLAPKMSFHIKLSTFLSRKDGCRPEEKLNNMYSCRTGRCIHMDLVCQGLNPCGDYSDCRNGSAAELMPREKGLHYVEGVVVAVVVVFLLFALIQICLIVRNEHTACHWKDTKVRIDAELMPFNDEANGHVVKDRKQADDVI